MHRVAAAIEHESVLSALAPDTVIDIGANRGQFALVVRETRPDATIFCFEPLPTPSSVLRKVFANDKRFVLHEIAIGPSSSKEQMHVAMRDDSSSLLPIGQLQETVFPGTKEASTAQVTLRPLHEMIDVEKLAAPALLKLDVQGYELEALKGCERLLQLFSHVYVECSFVELYVGQALAHEVLDWARARGFILSGVYNCVFGPTGQCIQGDLLFRNEAIAR